MLFPWNRYPLPQMTQQKKHLKLKVRFFSRITIKCDGIEVLQRSILKFNFQKIMKLRASKEIKIINDLPYKNIFRMNLIVQAIIKNWFLCGIVLFILLAWADPTVGMKGGPLHPEITIKYIGKYYFKYPFPEPYNHCNPNIFDISCALFTLEF